MAKTAQQILYEKRIREEEERRKKEEEERKKQATRITVSTAGKSAQQILYEQRIANAEAAKLSQQSQVASTAVADRPKDNGGFLGGLGYIGQSFLNGAVRGVEGIIDYTVGGLASIFGGDAGKEWAEELMTEDWYNYNAAAERYNPSAGWQFAGDVVGGVGQGVLAIGAGLAATLATGGGAAPAIIGAGIGGLSAAGTAVSDAVKDPNADKQGLDYTDWLYGTGAGALEAGIEAATGGVGKVTNKLFGKTLGEMGSEIAEAITKKAVKNTVTSSFGKELVKEMAGEGLEEGLSAFLEPYIKQATYDKDAENASLGDIAYSALVGAIAGGATSGAVSLTTSSINNADTFKRGSDIAKDSKKTADLLKNAEVISGYESERETGSEVFEAVVKQYEKVKNSLAGTGGAAQTNEQKKMLGELDRYVSAAVMQPAIVNAAKGVALNADSYAESLNAFYQKTNAGRTVTAADLTAGLKMDGTSKEFVNSVNRAMRSNTVLREVVVNNTLGRMEMDAQAYADSIYGDTRISAIATQENINRFVESADADTLSGVNKALGVDVRTATPELVAAAVKQFRDSGKAAAYEEGYRDVEAAKKVQNAERRAQNAVFEGSGDVEADTRTGYSDIETLERMIESSEGGTQSAAGDLTDADGTSGRLPLQEGATRFASGESDIAVIKHGDRYRIYDYKTGKITRSLTVSELRDIVGRMRGGERPAIEVIGRVLENGSVNSEFEIRNSELVQNVERIAEEKISEYKKLVETERESVRETVRRAMLNGVSEEDAALFGRIAAKSGMNIVVDTSSVSQGLTPSPRGEGSDAWYDGKNTVYVNADADRQRTFSGLLSHEMWHRMFKSGKARRIMMQAYKRLDKAARAEVEESYRADSESLGLGERDIKEINREEVAAAYAEEIFNSPDVWEFVLSEEQSLKDRVLKFFRGANKKYSFEPGMTKAAKKWLNEYKKLFNEVAAYNKGRSAAENTVASDKVRKIERIGRVVENSEFGIRNSELKLTNIKQEKMQVSDSGERGAIKKTTQGNFVEDKYYQRQIDKIDELKQGSYITVGEIQSGSALNKIGFPNSVVYFDVSKVIKEMRTRQDIIPSKIIKAIPDVLDNPIVITEYVDKNGMHSANVYGNLYINNSPVVVGVMMAQTQKGNIVSKIQTVHPNRNALKEMTDDKILYLSENKKETKSWFQSLGTQMLPLGGNKFGFIRSISQQSQKSNSFDKKTSKDFKNSVESDKNVDDGSRSALKKPDKEYRDKVKAKAEERIAKATAKAEAKYERATETAKARLEAEYTTDTVFSQSSVKSGFDSVAEVKKLPAKVREEISRDLWLELAASDDRDVRGTFILKYSVKMYNAIREADPDGHENMTQGERDALKGELEAAVKKIVNSGKKSKWAKQKDNVRGAAKLEAEVAGEIKSKIYQSLKRLDDKKKSRFAAASEYKGDEFKKTLDTLTRIDWRGKFSPNVARAEIKKLSEWYNEKNPMLEGLKIGRESFGGGFSNSVRIALDVLAEGEGSFSNRELMMLSDVVEYFADLVENYDKIYIEGKWVDGTELVYKFKDIAEKQKVVPIAIRVLRNKLLMQQTFGDPLSVMKLADMYEDGLFVTYYNEWQKGEIGAAAEEARIKDEYDSFFKKKENRKYLQNAMKETVELCGVEISKIDFIEYCMTLKREQADESIVKGGVRLKNSAKKSNSEGVVVYPVNDIQKGAGYEARVKAAVKAEYDRAIKKLSKSDLEYMKILERGYELAREVKALGDMQRQGFISVVEGYYYPIKHAFTDHMVDYASEAFAGDKYANASFNKRQTEGAKSALAIGSADDTFHRHIKGVTGYLHLSPVMDSFNKVYKLKVPETKLAPGTDVTEFMKERGSTTSLQQVLDGSKTAWRGDKGLVGIEYLQEIMLDTMGRGVSQKGDEITSALRGGYVKFALGGNPKVLFTQLSSLAASTSVLSRRSHLYGAAAWGGKVDEYSVVAKLRHGDNTVLKAQGVVENINAKTDFFMKGIEIFDRIVVRRAFAACQAEVARTEGFKIGTEENLKAAGKLLDKVILETQQNSFASSKTGAARRGNAFVKTLQMFKSDAVKGSARVIDAWGELAYIKKQLSDNSLNDAERKKLETRLKGAAKRLEHSITAVVMTAVYMGVVAELFRAFFGKLDDDEEWSEKWKRLRKEFIGNLIGGFPAWAEIYSSFTSNFGKIEGMEFSAVNDLLNTANKVVNIIGDGIEGKANGKDMMKLLESLIYGAGQIFGVPARNLKNVLYGVTRLVSKEAAYKMDATIKDMNFGADLENAIESGDDDLALTIIELALGERLGSGLSKEAIKELGRLAKLGENILPSAVGDVITVDGEERELSGSELKAVREIYGEAVERINVFVESAFYKSLNDKQKASAVRKIYTLYKDLGYDSVLGTERDKKAMMLSKLVSGDALVMWDACTVLEADKDEDGKTISGSKKEKVIKAIWSLDIPDVQKLLLIGMRGYKPSDGDIPGVSGYAAQMALYKYIESLEGLTDEERLDLFEASGFEIKGGAAQMPTYGSSSGGGSKRVTKIGHVVGGGTMKGTMIGSMMGKDYSKKIVKLGKIVN